jgi:hypothetical protein
MTAAANPRCRLAPRTSSPPCALSPQNSFSNTSSSILKSTAACSRCHRLIDFHHQRRKINSQNSSTTYQTLFNIHNRNQHHRDHGACRFLLTS